MGDIYLYTGTGAGKTAAALGLALRNVGHNKKTVIIQFCKWRKDTGEFLIQGRLGDLYEIYQFGREAWLGKETKTEEFGGERFKDALAFAAKIMQEQKPHLLVLDEVNLAAHWGLLTVKRVIEFLENVPKETTVVMTGRYAPRDLVDRADFVNELKDVKMPKKFQPTEGIQY